MKLGVWLLGLCLSALLIAASGFGWIAQSMTETLGFVTGLICVLLVVRENPWNFPIGIANNLVFLILFFEARLFADAGLQIVYAILGVHGWHAWLRGGAKRTRLHVSQVPGRIAVLSLPIFIAGAAVLVLALRALSGAAPVLDSSTTMLSLVAQYWLNRKYLENWILWMIADLIYIYLYVTRGLYLTAALYAVFFVLCCMGWRQWKKTLASVAGGSLEPMAARGSVNA